jgi:hypothetical protein
LFILVLGAAVSSHPCRQRHTQVVVREAAGQAQGVAQG